MKIEIPTEATSPEVLEAVAKMYNMAAEVMRSNRGEVVLPISKPKAQTAGVEDLRAEAAELVEEAETYREASEELRTPTANVTVNMPTVGDEGLDSAGNMWDASLHTRTKTKVADGTWKFQRGKKPEAAAVVPIDTVIPAQIEQAAQGSPENPFTPEQKEALAEFTQQPQTLTPEATAAAVTDVLGVPVAVEYPTAMGPFIAWVSNNGYTNVQVQTILEEWKIEGLTAIDGNAELIASICKELQK